MNVEMRRQLTRLEGVLSISHPGFLSTLAGGRPRAEMAEIWRREVGVTPPAEYLELHEWHDGTELSSPVMSFPYWGQFCGSGRGIESFRLFDAYELDNGDLTRWLPLWVADGWYLLISRDDESLGEWHHHEPEGPWQVFETMGSFLTTAADWWQSGVLQTAGSGVVVHSPAQGRQIHRTHNASSLLPSWLEPTAGGT